MSNLNPTTNQRQWEHKAHTTHDKNKHNKVKKTKEMNNLNPTTNLEGTQVCMRCKQFLSLLYKTPIMLLIYI
jgi:ribosomal 30S subunit maturation factor RimM